MITINEELRPKLRKLKETVVEMCYHIYNRRPTCAQLLLQYNQWGINSRELIESPNYHEQIEQFNNTQDSFFIQYLSTKLNQINNLYSNKYY